MTIEPVTLDGAVVRLEPLTLVHLDPLCAVGLDPELWRFTTAMIRTRDEMHLYIENALRWQTEGAAFPFAIYHKPSGKYVGSTRYANIDRPNKHLEIGWTWVARDWQRTPVNTETKYLLLCHAFDILRCIRVEFKTDSANLPSRNALLRIGAKEEGVFRNHMIVQGGRIRDSVYYSIIDAEWLGVKKDLESKLAGSSPHAPR